MRLGRRHRKHREVLDLSDPDVAELLALLVAELQRELEDEAEK